ncbi:putative glutathione S transferase [Xylaria sp. FL0933]|nr:putative glutathione S transferase [Xylaria sp. FL0933]
MANENAPEPSYKLYLYYTRYSSWGVRAQLIFEYFHIPYTHQYFSLSDQALAPPDLRVLPVLDVTPAPGPISTTTASSAAGGEQEEETLRIHDSFAIAEFLAEQHAEKHLWPADPQLRALARVAAAQMHSGFASLREAYPTNFVARYTGPGIPFTEAVQADVRKIFELWERLRTNTKKRLALLGEADRGFLCGGFSIADAFFWPVLWRLRSYDVPLTGLSDEGRKWMATMWNDPVMKAQVKVYFQQAANPESYVAAYDDVFKGNPDVTTGTFTEDWVFDGASA